MPNRQHFISWRSCDKETEIVFDLKKINHKKARHGYAISTVCEGQREEDGAGIVYSMVILYCKGRLREPSNPPFSVHNQARVIPIQ